LYDEQNELSHIPVEAGTKVDVQDPTGTWTHGTVVKFDIIDFEGDEEHKLRTLMVKVSYTWFELFISFRSFKCHF
jgi:hypothetical protein